MTDKTDKIGRKKKIGQVKDTSDAGKVEQTGGVGQTSGIQKTGAVSGVSGSSAGGTRRPTRSMTVAEREKLFEMVHDEAKKLFQKSEIPKEQQEVIEQAVKMAIDSGLTDEADEVVPSSEENS